MSHDLWVNFLATTLGRVVVVTTPLMDYRQHGGNAVNITARGPRVWVRSLGIAPHPKLPRAAVAEDRAQLLDELGRSTSDPELGRTATRAAAYWRRWGFGHCRRILAVLGSSECHRHHRPDQRVVVILSMAWHMDEPPIKPGH